MHRLVDEAYNEITDDPSNSMIDLVRDGHRRLRRQNIQQDLWHGRPARRLHDGRPKKLSR